MFDLREVEIIEDNNFSKLNISKVIEDILKVIKNNTKGPKKSISEFSESIQNNLKAILQICNNKYYDQLFFGAAALNRLILLDDEIANLLNTDTMDAIFQIEKIPLYRNSKSSDLASVLYWGFKEGVDVICSLPNNEGNYGLIKYKEQQSKFKKNTTRIIDAILQVAKKYNIALKEDVDSIPERLLYDRFVICSELIKNLKKEGKGDMLVDVPYYTTNAIREQSVEGLQSLCEIANIQHSINRHLLALNSISITDPNISTLEHFVAQFINNSQVLLDGWVSHVFYDRAHLEACLEQNNTIEIANKVYSLSHLIKEMVKQADSDKNGIAFEQLSLRFKLVEMDLKTRFPNEYQNLIANDLSQISLNEKRLGEKIQNLLLADHFKETTNKHTGLKILRDYQEEDYFAKFLEVCDTKEVRNIDGLVNYIFRNKNIQNLYQLGQQYNLQPTESNLQTLDIFLDYLINQGQTKAQQNHISLSISKETIKNLSMLAGLGLSTATGACIGTLLGTFVFPGFGTLAGALIGGASGFLIGSSIAGLANFIYTMKLATSTFLENSLSGVLTTAGSTGVGLLIGSIILPGLGSLIGAGVGLLLGVGITVIITCLSEDKEENLDDSEPLLITNSEKQLSKLGGNKSIKANIESQSNNRPEIDDLSPNIGHAALHSSKPSKDQNPRVECNLSLL